MNDLIEEDGNTDTSRVDLINRLCSLVMSIAFLAVVCEIKMIKVCSQCSFNLDLFFC